MLVEAEVLAGVRHPGTGGKVTRWRCEFPPEELAKVQAACIVCVLQHPECGGVGPRAVHRVTSGNTTEQDLWLRDKFWP